VLAWLLHLYSQDGVQQLIARSGLGALVAIIFAETGLFIGFALPGDSLLLATGVCCRVNPLALALGDADLGAKPLLPLGTTVLSLIAAALVGNLLNAWFGRLAGGHIQRRPDSRFFKRRHLAEATAFLAQWGGWALVAGRFVPVVRTFVPFAAGMAGMPAFRVVLWSTAGAVLWVGLMLLLGFEVASSQALVKRLHYLVLVVVALSFLPIAISLLVRWRRGAAAATSGAPTG
jgi:membrane-associated protein